jgi:ADP-dependent glucokinase
MVFTGSSVSKGSVLAVVAVLSAVCLYHYPDVLDPYLSPLFSFQVDERGGMLKKILESLLEVEKKHPLRKKPRVAVGYGGCLDVVVDARDVFNFSSRDPPRKPRHHHSIKSWEALEEVFLYFFDHGAAGE